MGNQLLTDMNVSEKPQEIFLLFSLGFIQASIRPDVGAVIDEGFSSA